MTLRQMEHMTKLEREQFYDANNIYSVTADGYGGMIIHRKYPIK